MSNYEKLAAINVNEHIEKKGQFSYLSWPFAVDTLRKACPEATWEVKRFDGLPYMKTECGYFVEVAVTVDGVALSQIHPVLNNQNKPIPQPNAFDINTSLARCLVKAIALHGLGLYIYAGEDLPEPPESSLSKEQMAKLADLAKIVQDFMKAGEIELASNAIRGKGMGAEEHTAMWDMLSSSERSAIKAYDSVMGAKTIDALKLAWEASPKHAHKMVEPYKDKRKAALTGIAGMKEAINEPGSEG